MVEPSAAPLVVRADRLRIAQALANLVANAVEHGGGEVRVRARAVDGRARIEVTDGGPGLPAPRRRSSSPPRAAAASAAATASRSPP